MGMHRMNPEYLDPDSSDRSVTADILLRQEPDEDENDEEEEDEGDNRKKMTRKATKGTQSERVTCPDFAQADDGQREPYRSCQCDSGSPGVKIAISRILSMSAPMG